MVNFDAENKLMCKITLESIGDAKISVIRVLRDLRPELDLSGAKELVKDLPSVIGDEILHADAEQWKAKLATTGAKVTIRLMHDFGLIN